MPKIHLVISVVSLIAALIVGEAVYAFTRPEKLTMTQGIVLIGIAIAGLIVLMVTLLFIWKGLNKSPKKDK